MMIALVTGARQGLGRGIAEGLAEAGATVWFTVRPETDIKSIETELESLGGTAHGLAFDHAGTDGLDNLFKTIREMSGPPDLLVNSVWGGYERMVEGGRFTWADPFWKQPDHRWSTMMEVGVKSAYVAAQHAARQMIGQKRGLIVNLSFWAAQTHMANVLYGMAKAATDKMTADMAHELRGTGVSVLSLYPGLVRTERVMRFSDRINLANSESPRLTGRVIATLTDTDRQAWLQKASGSVQLVAELARQFGITDVDGASPVPLSLADVTETA